MPDMNDDWVIEDKRREAREECARCQGRQHGDCYPECRYWGVTATRAEREAARRQSGAKAVRSVRPWTGPVMWEATEVKGDV